MQRLSGDQGADRIPLFLFVSNYINHHQIPFCNAMYGLLGGEFAFLQTEPMEDERIRMGWQTQENLPYLHLYYKEPKRYQHWIDSCRVVLFGGTDEEAYIRPRLESGLPVVRYSERLYKSGQWKFISPRGLRKKYQDHVRYRRKPVYMLCAGAYVPSDFALIHAYPGKLLKWGYFPEVREYDADSLFAGKEPGRILWAGRFLDWKHPELPVQTARYLREKGIPFQMDIVGGGDMEPQVRQWVREYGLEDQVCLPGFQTPDEVRTRMERADIYLVTSDRYEGWGAVVNEAMNSGCAVVADHMIGAAPFLIQHGKNGLLYQDGREDILFRQVETLLKDRALCRHLGRNALETISGEWNAETAARRLAEHCVRLDFLTPGEVPGLGLQGGEKLPPLPLSGPMSAAEVVPERKMYRHLIKKADDTAGREVRSDGDDR